MKKYIAPATLIILVILSLFLFVQNRQINAAFNHMEDSVNSVLSLNREELDRTTSNLNLIASGTNQLRLQNGLAPLNIDYGHDLEESSIDPDLEEEKKKDIFFEALDYLIDVNKEYDLRSTFEEDFLTTSFQSFLKKEGIEVLFDTTLSGRIVRDGEKILSFSLGAEVHETLDVYGNKSVIKTPDEFTAAVQTFFDDENSRVLRNREWRQNLTAYTARDEVKAMITEKDLKLKLIEEEGRFTLLIRLSDYIVKEKAGLIPEEGKLFLGSETYADWDSFDRALTAYLLALDGRTDREIRDAEVKDLILSVLVEENFSDYLKENNLTLSPVIRQSEETDYINWDFMDERGRRIGSFALLEGFGELYLLDGDDVVLRSFRNLSENHATLNLDGTWSGEKVGEIDYITTSAAEETFLVVGSHERNADTIILVHVNRDREMVDMISIPRDLWFKNRKLNSVYRYYGIDALARDVSELTGLTIDKYMAIDMYAFIDVINIMGGIDVVLEESLVDPTYHIKENGIWSTLNYPAGPIHLDGLGALRVARSRHSTNDYSRSRRQQLIIGAIFDKLSSMGLSDLDQLSEFVKAGLRYTETNIPAGTLIMDVMKYRNCSINSQNVIDATNVLYESYSNIYRLPVEEQQNALDDEDFYLGAWIVLPRNENYNLIKWRIQEIIKHD